MYIERNKIFLSKFSIKGGEEMTLYDKIHSIKNTDTPIIISDSLKKDEQSFVIETVSGEIEYIRQKYKELVKKNVVSEDSDGNKKMFIIK